MPLEIDKTVLRPALELVAQEIVDIHVKTRTMTCEVRATYVDNEGQQHPELDEDFTLELVRDGAARFSPELRAMMKQEVYALAIEDGFLAGKVT